MAGSDRLAMHTYSVRHDDTAVHSLAFVRRYPHIPSFAIPVILSYLFIQAMVELVGTVSAAISLVEFTGRILHGCLVAKEFFHDKMLLEMYSES